MRTHRYFIPAAGVVLGLITLLINGGCDGGNPDPNQDPNNVLPSQ